MEATLNWSRSLAREPQPQTIVGGRSKPALEPRAPLLGLKELPGTSGEASRYLFSTCGSYQPVRRRSPSREPTMDKTPTPTTFDYGPQAPSCPSGSGVLLSARTSWPSDRVVPSSRPAHVDIIRHPTEERSPPSAEMLGDPFTTFSSRQDRRFQNTYEDRPFEIPQRLPHPVQESVTPLHDEHLRQDQQSSQRHVQSHTTYASTAIPAATAHSAVTFSSRPAAAVPRPPMCTATLEARSCPSGREEPRSTNRFDARTCPSGRVEPGSSFDEAAPSEWHRQPGELLHQPQSMEHHELPVHHSAVGGRGSFGVPPAGPVDSHAADNGYETSAFYRNATFHRAAPGSTASPLVLTELPIPKFDGDIRRYPMFRNRFLDIVEGRPDLAPRHKLLHLLQFLRGEPYQLANNFEFSDANYFIVINRLEEQYGDKCRLRQLLAQDFIAIRPPIGGVADLRRFHDDAFRVTTELRSLGEDTEATVVYEQTLMGKLPVKLKEEIVRNSEYCRKRTVTSILDGLREYAHVLDEVNNSGIRFDTRAPATPEAPCQERHDPPARSSSECSAEESTECSEDAGAEQPTTCVAEVKALMTNIVKQLEAQRMCQFCGHPHVAVNCNAYTTVNQRLRRSQKLSLCPLCLREGHRVDSCPRRGTDTCSHCGSGTHHRATCRAAASGAPSETLHCNSKCATRGSKDDPASSDLKRHSRTTLRKRAVNREVTIAVATATKLRHSGARRNPTKAEDNPNRKKRTRNSGIRSKGRESTTRPSTTSTDESVMLIDAEACGNARSLPARPDLLQTARCSTNDDSPQFNQPVTHKSLLDWDPFDEPWDKAESSTKCAGRHTAAPTGPSDATSDDCDRFPAYKEVRAYVASASTNDAQAPLLECLEVTAVNPTTGATRRGIVFFDSGSTFSYISSTLARDLNLPNRGKCVRRVHTFGCPVPTIVEGLSTSVVLCSPQGHQVSLGIVTADFAIPSVRTALVEDADLPSLRRNEQSISPTRVTPDILIGQDRIHLFGRQQGSRLPAGYEVVHSIFGPTIGGAPRVATTQPKAVPSTSAAPVAEVSGPLLGSLRQLPSGTVDASSLKTIASPSQPPSSHLPPGKPKPAPVPLTEKGLGASPHEADNHPCQKNELRGDSTSTTLRADLHLLQERTERSELLQWKPNPLDTACPLQSGPHSTSVVLQPELQPGHQPSAERNQQRERRPPVNAEQTSATGHYHELAATQNLLHTLQQPSLMLPLRPTQLSFDPPTRPLEAATTAHNAESSTLAVCARVPPTPPSALRGTVHLPALVSDYRSMADASINVNVPPGQHGDTLPDTARDDRLYQYPVTGEAEHRFYRAITTPKEPATQKKTTSSKPAPLAGKERGTAEVVSSTTEAADDNHVQAGPSKPTPLVGKESGAPQAPSEPAPLAGKDSRAPQAPSETAPLAGQERRAMKESSSSAPLAVASDEGVPQSDETNRTTQPIVASRQHRKAAAHVSADLSAVAQINSGPITNTERRSLIDDLANTLMALYGKTLLHELPSDLKMHLPDRADPANDAILDSILQYALRKAAAQLADNYPALLKDLPALLINADPPVTTGDNRSTYPAQAPAPAPAHSALGLVARADPLDQEDNASRVPPMSAANLGNKHRPASPPSPVTRCTPAEAPLMSAAKLSNKHRPASPPTPVTRCTPAEAPPMSAANLGNKHRPASPPTPVTRCTPAETPEPVSQPPMARRPPADQAASSSDDVRRSHRDDSPLKNETVCFADGSTFQHFGCLLRPEVLMVPTPVPSLHEALQIVYDFRLPSEVSRVVFWFSDSHVTPLSPAVQLRLVIELSRHYATHYQTITQYVVATPSIGSRQDILTYGIFKLLVQMQVLLPHARLIMRPRRGRSVTHADVVALKRYLRDHHHLSLWSRYDADIAQAVEAPFSSPMSQRHVVRATLLTSRKLIEDYVPPTQAEARNAGGVANATRKDDTTITAAHAGSACRSGNMRSRQLKNLRDGPAVQPTTQFPPPPSRSRFHSTLSEHHGTDVARTTCSTPLVGSGQARKPKTRRRSKPAPLAVREPTVRKRKSRCCSKPAPLAVRDPTASKPKTRSRSKPAPLAVREPTASKPKTPSRSKPATLAVREPTMANPRGKKKEHSFRDENHLRSKDKKTPAAQVVDDTEAENSENQVAARRLRVCAFCGHPHCVAKCIFYRSRTKRVRRAKELGYCFICLRSGHAAQECPSRTTSPCKICNHGHHHHALCPLAAPSVAGAVQSPPRRTPPSGRAPSPTTIAHTPGTILAQKREEPGRLVHSTDDPPAAQMPPILEPTEAHHRRKPRNRKDREPRT